MKVELENPALNVVGFAGRPAEAVIEDLASWAVENNVGKLHERINPRVIFFRNGQLVDPKENLKPLNQGLRVETRLDKLENRGYQDICSWLKKTNFGYGLWISPPSKVYSETRFVVYQVETQNGEKVVSLWGLCGYQTGEQCLKIANSLQTERIFYHPDKLRAKVIPFQPLGNSPWTYYLNLFGIAPLEVWQAIENGDAQKAKETALAGAAVVYRRAEQDFGKARNFEQKAQIVYNAENEMRQRLGRDIRPGPCVSTQSIFNTVFNKTEKKEGEKTYTCPYCGAKVGAGQKCPVQGCDWRAPA